MSNFCSWGNKGTENHLVWRCEKSLGINPVDKPNPASSEVAPSVQENLQSVSRALRFSSYFPFFSPLDPTLFPLQ